MKHELETIIAGRHLPADLTITYGDLYGQGGGSGITVHGDGRVECQMTNQVGEGELATLIALLIELTAWEQLPERPPAPDETSASLTISVGGRLSRVWERFDELQTNSRLLQIRTRMEQLARQRLTRPALAQGVPLLSPRQLPELTGETLILIWDQVDADSTIRHGDTIIWRERTGWEVYERFEEIAAILKHTYGERLIDLVPTQRSLYALYGDSSRASAHVSSARQALLRELPTETFHWLGLAEAAGNGDAATIRRYLAQGGDPDIRSVARNSADTLLHIAAQRRQIEIARLLIVARANVNAMDSLEKSPLVAALDTANMPAAIRALERWNYDAAALLPGPTAELVRLLVEGGAHPSGLNRPFSELQGLKSEMYRPPLALAARYGYTDAVRVLLEHGAEVDGEDYLGDTPLITAIRWGRAEPAQVLIAAGADVKRVPYSPDNDANSQLQIVIKSERFEPGHKLPLLERMIDAGADVNRFNAVGDTPLLTAVRYAAGNSVELASIVRMLRVAGADVDARGHDGKLARELAANANLTDLAALL